MRVKVKRIGLSIAYILGLYVLIFICRPIYIYSIIQNFSNQKYIDDLTVGGQGFRYLVLLIYCFVSFFWTKRTFLPKPKTRLLYWILNWVIDFMILPLSVLFLVLYHNHSAVSDMKNLSSVENVFLIWLLLATKHIIFHIVNRNISLGSK